MSHAISDAEVLALLEPLRAADKEPKSLNGRASYLTERQPLRTKRGQVLRFACRPSLIPYIPMCGRSK